MFATYDDVADRYEGIFPIDRRTWVELRISDVEAELTGLVPSLLRPDVSEARKARARRLVADKVLELFRNPRGVTSWSSTKGPFADQESVSKAVSTGRLSFSEDELASVRLRRSSPVGMVRLAPWRVP